MVFPLKLLNLPLLRASTSKWIRHGFSPPGERSDTDSFDNTNTEIITRNNGRSIDYTYCY